jgi:3-hydroxybutyryl-CoA dehydrogenase
MKIATIAIVGAGELGRRIAFEAARAGYRSVLEDVSRERLDEALAAIKRMLADDLSLERLSGAERELTLARIVTASSAEQACREADLIIETVADEEEMKIELFTIFDKFAKPEAILASTSLLTPLSELAAITVCPERCVGMHFTSAAEGASTLELVQGPRTSDETITACRETGLRVGKEVIVVKEKPPESTRADQEIGVPRGLSGPGPRD